MPVGGAGSSWAPRWPGERLRPPRGRPVPRAWPSQGTEGSRLGGTGGGSGLAGAGHRFCRTWVRPLPRRQRPGRGDQPGELRVPLPCTRARSCRRHPHPSPARGAGCLRAAETTSPAPRLRSRRILHAGLGWRRAVCGGRARIRLAGPAGSQGAPAGLEEARRGRTSTRSDPNFPSPWSTYCVLGITPGVGVMQTDQKTSCQADNTPNKVSDGSKRDRVWG